MERWTDVPGYVGIYQVSDRGEVRTTEGKTTHSIRHGVRTWTPRTLKQKTDKKGYKRVVLYKDKTPKTWLVHRIVAFAFCDRVPGQELVNHIDGNPANNHYTNLEWCDSKHNVNHAFDNSLMTTARRVMLTASNGQAHTFRSLAEASRFLGRNNGYLSGQLQKGKSLVDGYTVSYLN